MVDLFKFWEGLSPLDARIHPADKWVLDHAEHHFELNCLAGSFFGRLRTAPVVLLFLSPGFGVSDLEHAKMTGAQEYYVRQRTGNCDLPSENDHKSARIWASERIRQFGVDYENTRSKIAFLNIAPYKSASFHDKGLLASLPSCRATLDWAQSFLFPKAEAGERVVVCLRSPDYWGLGKEVKIGKSLFSPTHTRNGYIQLDERPAIAELVRKAVNR